jgi:hypothetical protein
VEEMQGGDEKERPGCGEEGKQKMGERVRKEWKVEREKKKRKRVGKQ